MTLITHTDRVLLLHNARSGKSVEDQVPVVKLHLPILHFVCLLTDIDPANHNIAYGLCDFGLGSPQYDSIKIKEAAAFTTRFGKQIERDPYFLSLYPVRVYADAALFCQHITDNPFILDNYVR